MADQEDPTKNLMGPDTFNNIKSQWDTFLEAPGGRAALLSAGISLLQPPSFGDTTGSQIGRAIGAAGESVSRNEAFDLKQREAESKALAREAQASSREAAAGIAGNKLELQKMNVESLIALRQAQTDAVPIKAEAARLKAEAAAAGPGLRQQELLIRAQAQEAQANNMVSQAQARAAQAAHAAQSLQLQERAQGARESQSDISNRLKLEDLNRKAEDTSKIFGGTPKILTLDQLRGGGGNVAPAATEQSKLDAARKWLDENPNDPYAPQVRQRLGL